MFDAQHCSARWNSGMMEYWSIGYKSGKELFYKIDRIHSNPLF
jgi:hypothetical protein